MKEIKVALIGIPNSGKTTLFNAMTGGFGRTGNWSGVTVDILRGNLVHKGCKLDLTDLPGTYSLNPGSSDEEIVPKYLLFGDYDIVLIVLDGANLRTSMYLALQVLESNIPVVLAINKADMMKGRGISVDLEQLSYHLGCPVVPIVSTKKVGITDLMDSLLHEAHHHVRSDVMHPLLHDRFSHRGPEDGVDRPHIHGSAKVNLIKRKPLVIRYPKEIEVKIGNTLENLEDLTSRFNARFIALRYIEGDKHLRSIPGASEKKSEYTSGAEEDDEDQMDLVDSRYDLIDELIPPHQKVEEGRLSRTIERMVTSTWLGIPIFLSILLLLFTATYVIGSPLSGMVQFIFDGLSQALSSSGDQWYISILRDGLIPGVGSVMTFFPMIFILFFMISLLENSGYMARGVYVIDRGMARLGLPGRSFIPLVMGFGCNVPAIMAARSIPNLRDRIATILLVPFITCAARLPVLMLMSSIFFGIYAGLIVVSMYVISIFSMMLSSFVITRLLLKGSPSPLIMDIPPYSIPSLKVALRSGSMNTYLFIKKASTVILVAMLIVWGMTYMGIEGGSIRYLGNENDDRIAGPPGTDPDPLEGSLASEIGRLLEPLFRPLGFNWKLVVSLLFGIVAKEIVLGTMGILTGGGDADINEGIVSNSGLDRSGAFVFLVFFTLYIPCIPAIAVIRKETGSNKWAMFSAMYNLGFAYLSALVFKTIFAIFGGV